jgi:hypothetical protein
VLGGEKEIETYPKKDNYGLAIASMILGIISLCAWFFPICGFPLSVIVLILGIVGQGSSGRGMAIVGIVMTIIGLVLTIINAAVGTCMGATGQMQWINNLFWLTRTSLPLGNKPGWAAFIFYPS